MFSVVFGDEEYHIDFSYDRNLEGDWTDKTYCAISTGPLQRGSWIRGTNVEGIGVSSCHKMDQFDKNTGRKLALEYALDNIGWDRVKRGVVWQQYFETRNGKYE